MLRFFDLDLPTLFPDRNLQESTTIILAAIATVKLTDENTLGMPYYKGDTLGPIEVIDVSRIQCIVGRMKDRGSWAIIERGDHTERMPLLEDDE